MLKLNNWYIRLLVSYFPILVLTVSMIIFLSFIAVNEISRSETAKADKITTGYVVDSIENALHEVEFTVLNEAAKNLNYSAYLNGSQVTTNKYNVVHSLRALVEDSDLIESVYLFRETDDKVLTPSAESDLADFGDRAFIEQAKNKREFQGWSVSREYREFDRLEPVRVISMYKQTPLPFGKDGILVINVDLYTVEQIIGSMTNHQVSFMHITDAAGQLIYPVSNNPEEAKGGKVLTTLASAPIGWTFESGIQDGHLLGWVSVVSYVWVILAVLTFVAAIITIIWVTRRNYKPIQLMMNRIQTFQLRDSGGNAVGMDDLTMIDRALENLIVQSQDYEKEQRESAVLQRRQLFSELISGQRGEKTIERMRKLQLLPDTGHYAVMVVRLNRYEEFQSENTPNEQNVLKFALGNVLQELAMGENLTGWGEWSTADRITFVFAMQDNDEVMLEQLRKTASVARQWVGEHLRLVLSFGIGSIVPDWNRTSQSYRDALSGMEYELSIGRDAITYSGDIPRDNSRGTFHHMQQCTECVQQFRLTNENWRETFEQLFAELKTDKIKDEDIHSLMQLFLQTLSRELKDLSDTLNEWLDDDRISALTRKVGGAVSLAEMKELLLDYLLELYDAYVAMGENKSYKTMMTEMKAYIQANFADPDLSLKHLSDRFQISGKYASHLFKLEYDMKFVDFLVQLRMQQAERLLAETDETVQNIAMQVGYANSITFGRVFKRTTGVTPGEYRRLKVRPAAES
ncbi:AraC-like DNA-binding protein [Paenibacillus phyllosphaerae]|uniref:AraC-like DNA-binding protein n=1 Tax=Paenibacillus phyllosphaerae TaxID=274593 RepID=A0A7W5AVQ0_9BACL|nr:helix-turn-helix domain-containing protein [Paenibacillus phyllosphaerae]MBB3109655.1 AraC-like DNA-binding protein [Paenibacillus phyllosphaerae]